MTRIFVALTLLGGILLLATIPAHEASAASISIAPLKYEATLSENENKKGFIDILNPEPAPIDVRLKAQAFRQIDDEGNLTFYDSPAISEGVQLDVTEITLGPNEGARIYFILDAASLPSGDVFAAILANADAPEGGVVGVPTPQVGTLLLVTNGQPPKHTAEVKSLSAPWLQIGEGIKAQIALKNTNPPEGPALGFIPKINFAITPYQQQTVTGPLLFSGRSRVVDYIQRGDYFGPAVLSASVDGSTRTQIVFAVTGFWRWLAPLIFIGLVAIILTPLYLHKRHRKKHPKQR